MKPVPIAIAACIGGVAGGLVVDRLQTARLDRIEHDIRDIGQVVGQHAKWHGGISANLDLLREKLRDAGVITSTEDFNVDWSEGSKYTVSPRRCSCGAP